MIVLGLADIHGDLQAVASIGRDSPRPDVVVVAGDLTSFGRRDAAARVLKGLRRLGGRLLAVPGNCDPPEVTDYLENEGVCIHCKSIVIKSSVAKSIVDGVAFVGLGLTPGTFCEGGARDALDAAAGAIPDEVPLVLVTHAPPRGTLVDLTRSGAHAGNGAVREFIEARRPILCVSGHIHEAQGIDSMGETFLVNPGLAAKGFYARAVIGDGVEDLEILGPEGLVAST